MDRKLTDATEIIVNAKYSEKIPAILIVYSDSVVTVSLIHAPMILESLKVLEQEGKIRVESSNDTYTLFVPADSEEKRDTPVCTFCGSICIKSKQEKTDFVCLNCGHYQ